MVRAKSASGIGAANYFDKIAMRREVIETFVRRRPGLTAREIRDGLDTEGYFTAYPFGDLKWLLKQGRVHALKANARTVLWFPPVPPAMPLRWEGDDA